VRSVCLLQDDDCHVNIHFFITYKNVWMNDNCVSFLLLFVTSSRGSVDIGSVDLSQVHHFTVSLFSCAMGEECWLCFISDDHQVTDMPLLLTRMFGHMMTAFYIVL
jgi:hypothetical protein